MPRSARLPMIAAGLLFLVLAAALVLRSATRSDPQPRFSGAERALRLWTAQRAYPATTLPPRGLTEAFALSKARLSEDAAKTGHRDPWESIGPHNLGGRTLAVALNPHNPNTIYAGSASGGLWRSYTGGVGTDAWDYVSTGFPVLGVSSIAIDPTDSNVLYIGTGEVYSYYDTQGGITVRHTRGSYGMGILKTEDGGQTWSHSLDWAYQQQRGIWAVRINPLNPATVWAGTTEGTFKSLDAGRNWTQVDATIMVTDLVIDPGDTNRVIIACGNFSSPGVGLYRTEDGGDSWQRLTHPHLPNTWAGKAQLAVCPAAPGVIYASIGNGDVGSYWTRLVRSTDGGNNWISQSTTDYAYYQGWFAHDVGVDPSDPQKVLALGIDIYKSTNGGIGLTQKTDWSLWDLGQTPAGGPEGPPDYSHADHHDITYHPTQPDTVYVANDGGIFRSTDGGETWAGCNGGYQTQQFYAGFSSSDLDPTLAMGGMQDNATAIYSGDVAWYRTIGGDGSWTAIDPTDPDIMFGSAQFLQLLKSTDGGVFWDWAMPDEAYFGEAGFIAPFRLGHGAAGAQTVYAAGTKVAKSVDGGASWGSTNAGAVLDGNPALSLAVSPLDRNVVYVTTAPVSSRCGVFRTDDGDMFEDVTDNLPDRYPVGLAIDPNDDRTVYVTLSGFGTSHVFKSTTGGGDWQDIGVGLPDVPTSTVIVDPLYPEIVYVGNDIGVYFTTDGGQRWHEYSIGLPDAVMAMDLNILAADRRLRVATYGNGAFERDMVEGPVPVQDQLPRTVANLRQNRPNPFNPSTTIAFSLHRSLPVSLMVYDAAGRQVRTLVAEYREAGDHTARWDGRDDDGRALASGVYVYKLRAGSELSSKKMTLVR